MLDLVDDVAAGQKGLLAVPRAHPHPHGHLAQLQIPDAMHAGGVFDAEALPRLGDDALAFLGRQQLEGLVLQMPHLLAFVVIAHPAFKRGIAAAGRVDDLRARSAAVSMGVLAKLKDFTVDCRTVRN